MIKRRFLFATACALAVAFVHVSYDTLKLHIFEQFTWTSRDFVWMAPIAYLTFFLILAALTTLLPRRPGEIVIGTFAAWSALLLWQKLHPLAAIVLSLGIGVALVDVWQRDHRGSATRRTVYVLATLAVGLAGGSIGGR